MPVPALSRVTVSQLDLAARHVVTTALGVSAAEAVVIFADATSVRMGDALARAVEARDGEPRMVWLDDLGERPLPALPAGVLALLESAAASVFVAGAPHAELAMRRELLAELTRRGLRHAHMPGVSHLAFVRGLRVDYDVVAGHGMRLMAFLRQATSMVVSSPAGTRLRVRFAPGTKWMPQLGRIEPGRWGNLPAGALYAVPESVDGTYVANAAVGSEGTERRPVWLEIAAGKVEAVSVSADLALERRVREHLAAGPYRDRVGLVAIGCNYGIVEPTGEALVDQNMPGLHLALGDAASEVTGLAWRASGSLACCAAGTTVIIERETVVRSGVLVEPS